MSRSAPPRLARWSGSRRRTVRHSHDGCRPARGTGAAPSPPYGVAPPQAGAGAMLLLRSAPVPPVGIVMAAALATLVHVSPVAAGPIEDRARAAAQASRATSSDSAALQTHYLTPGLSAQPITTVDGQRSFTPTIACQKSATLLDILVQPSATGDLTTVQIGRDVDLDGAIDTRTRLPVAVSGICANGVVACSPGSWNQCHYLRWDVDAARMLVLTEVDMPALSACYCINNSCGTNLAWSNMASVLGDLGGGMVGALTTADPRIGVAQAMIDGPTIRYVGAQSTACAASPDLPQFGYRAAPMSLAGDASAAATGSSLFQTLISSPVAAGTVREMRACSIARQVTIEGATIDDVISRVAGGYATSKTPGVVDFQLGSPSDDALAGGNCRLFDFRMTLNVAKPDRLQSVILSELFFDDWIQVRVDGALLYSNPTWTSGGFPPGGCERGRTWHASPGLDLKPYLTAGDHEIWLRVAVGGEGEASATIRAEVDERCVPDETLADGCGGYAVNPACTIDSETVDGIQTFRDGVKTGLSPLPQTRFLGTTACPVELSRPFFRKDRQYRCEIDNGGLPAPDLSRARYIIDHSTETMLADRSRQRDGEYAALIRPFALPERGSVPACEPVCKSRAPRQNVAAAPAGVVGALQNDPASYDSFYHACGPDNLCPLGPGEELVTACSCLDAFPEAAAMMQTVRLAGADLLCTGVAQ